MPIKARTFKPARSRVRQPDTRAGSTARGYGSRWQKARAAYLLAHPLCRTCESNGKLTPATVVDHISPHKGDMRKFWESDNWQPLCKRCHDVKTATQDGAFGREARSE